jgi:FKBP-type peptidyl-prolyl cis-trans isomerase
MPAISWCRIACFATIALFLLANLSTARSEDVALPTLPKGAGEMDKDAPKVFTKTASGLKYRVLRAGKGQKPQATDNVKVNYHGWLDGGKVFDSSYGKDPISFPLNGVIKGWTEGMQLVGEGGMVELEIPAALGYGKQGIPGTIPGGASLHFLVELIKVE